MSDYRNDFREVKKEATWTFWQVLWPILGFMVVLSVVGFVFMLLSRPAQVVEKVTNPDRIIANYEYFRDTLNDAKALDRQIASVSKQIDDYMSLLPDDRTRWAREDTTEVNRLNAVLTGMRTQRESVVADYNSKSSMLTRNLFKGQDVPYQLTVQDDKTVEIW